MAVDYQGDGATEEPATDNLLEDPWGDGEELDPYEYDGGESDPSFWDVATGEADSPLEDPVQDPEETAEDVLVEDYDWTREQAEAATDGADPTDPTNYEPPDWEAPDINFDPSLPEVPDWAPYAAAGVGLLLVLTLLRPYASMGASAAEVAA